MPLNMPTVRISYRRRDWKMTFLSNKTKQNKKRVQGHGRSCVARQSPNGKRQSKVVQCFVCLIVFLLIQMLHNSLIKFEYVHTFRSPHWRNPDRIKDPLIFNAVCCTTVSFYLTKAPDWQSIFSRYSRTTASTKCCTFIHLDTFCSL